MRKSKTLKVLGLFCLVLVLLVSIPLMSACAKETPAPTPSPAPTPKPTPAPMPETVADFYKNNRATLIVNASAGGGSDYASRLVASYWSDVTDGAMVVKNKGEGGGMAAMHYMQTAKPEGLEIGVCDLISIIGNVIFEDPAVEYDLKSFNWIGSVSQDPLVFALSSKLPYNSTEGLKDKKDIKFGVRFPRQPHAIGEALIAQLYDLDAEIVSGFKGGSEIGLALGRGELDGFIWNGATVATFIDRGYCKQPFFTFDLERTGQFPDTPTITEVVQLTPEQESLVKVLVYTKSQKGFFLAPGTPQDKVDFVRQAFDQVMAIKAFEKQVKMRWAVGALPMSGQELTTHINEALNIPKTDIAKGMELVEQYSAR
ncbi:Bug family tripartite tricarboxylate transporter substrate binding protein [Chloroflexota bacterium]